MADKQKKPKVVTFKVDGVEASVSEGGEFTILVPVEVHTNNVDISYTHTVKIQVLKVT